MRKKPHRNSADTLDGSPPAAIVGKFFHTLTDDGTVEYQGYVVSNDEDGLLVQLFGWLTGGESSRLFLTARDMKHVVWYDSDKELRAAYRLHNQISKIQGTGFYAFAAGRKAMERFEREVMQG